MLLRTCALSIALTTWAAAQPTTPALTYGAWWEQPALREGYVVAALKTRTCERAGKRHEAIVAEELWRLGIDRPDLWPRPLDDVFALYCASR